MMEVCGERGGRVVLGVCKDMCVPVLGLEV